MAEFMNAERFTILVARRLKADGIQVKDHGDGFRVEGFLEDIVYAVLDEHSEHGPVMFGD